MDGFSLGLPLPTSKVDDGSPSLRPMAQSLAFSMPTVSGYSASEVGASRLAGALRCLPFFLS